jgi:hypothetical protein
MSYLVTSIHGRVTPNRNEDVSTVNRWIALQLSATIPGQSRRLCALALHSLVSAPTFTIAPHFRDIPTRLGATCQREAARAWRRPRHRDDYGWWE